MSAESSGRCSNSMRCSRARSPNANEGGTCTFVSWLVVVSAALRDRRVGREFFGAHEDFCEVAGGPLGTGLFVVARDGAEDDVGSRGGRLFLELFSLCEVLLSCETGLSFPCGLNAEDGGGMEGSTG